MTNISDEDIINAIRLHIEDIGDSSNILMRKLLSFKATLRLIENGGRDDENKISELSDALDGFVAVLKQMNSLREMFED